MWQLAGVIDSTSHLRGNGDSSHKARALFVPAAAILPRRRALGGNGGPILALSLSAVFVSRPGSCYGSKPRVFGISCLRVSMTVGRYKRSGEKRRARGCVLLERLFMYFVCTFVSSHEMRIANTSTCTTFYHLKLS